MIGTLLLFALLGTAAGCGSNSGPSLMTGSLFGSGDKVAEAPAPKPVTPSERALQVATTTARAQRCGFVFDPEQLRSNYLAAEAQAGTPPDQIQRVTKEFDTLRGSVAKVISADDAYCTEGRTREVKASLTRHLAGDFNPTASRQVASGGGLLDGINQGNGREVFVPSAVFDPNRKGVTKRVDD